MAGGNPKPTSTQSQQTTNDSIYRRRAASWSLLGIFLGGFGVHRFLLGYTTIGIVQILVTLITCGFGAWWGISRASC